MPRSQERCHTRREELVVPSSPSLSLHSAIELHRKPRETEEAQKTMLHVLEATIPCRIKVRSLSNAHGRLAHG